MHVPALYVKYGNVVDGSKQVLYVIGEHGELAGEGQDTHTHAEEVTWKDSKFHVGFGNLL